MTRVMLMVDRIEDGEVEAEPIIVSLTTDGRVRLELDDASTLLIPTGDLIGALGLDPGDFEFRRVA